MGIGQVQSGGFCRGGTGGIVLYHGRTQEQGVAQNACDRQQVGRLQWRAAWPFDKKDKPELAARR